MARIRTVKPEFFTHPVYARLEDAEQILALGLLTHADDHGYFRADPEIVRGAVRPFWESRKLRDSLARLREVGWWTLRHHPEQGPLGLIATWTKHQKVDHPKASKIRVYWEEYAPSESSRILREDFALEQGTGNREQGGEFAKPPTPPGPKKVDHLKTALEGLGMSTSADALREWGRMCTKRAKCSSVADALEFIAWAVERGQRDGVTIRYSKDAAGYADQWAARRRA